MDSVPHPARSGGVRDEGARIRPPRLGHRGGPAGPGAGAGARAVVGGACGGWWSSSGVGVVVGAGGWWLQGRWWGVGAGGGDVVVGGGGRCLPGRWSTVLGRWRGGCVGAAVAKPGHRRGRSALVLLPCPFRALTVPLPGCFGSVRRRGEGTGRGGGPERVVCRVRTGGSAGLRGGVASGAFRLGRGGAGGRRWPAVGSGVRSAVCGTEDAEASPGAGVRRERRAAFADRAPSPAAGCPGRAPGAGIRRWRATLDGRDARRPGCSTAGMLGGPPGAGDERSPARPLGRPPGTEFLLPHFSPYLSGRGPPPAVASEPAAPGPLPYLLVRLPGRRNKGM